jgi:hypothetical protein
VTRILDLGSCRFGLVAISRGEQNEEAAARELAAHFQPNAAVCAGDQRHT